MLDAPVAGAPGSTDATARGRPRAAASSSDPSRPRRAPAPRRRTAPRSSGGTPDFVGSPERLTSTSAGMVSRLAAESESSEWHELAQPGDLACLARLEVADEVPAKRLALGSVFRDQVLESVLADDLDARLGEDTQLLGRRRTSSRRRSSRPAPPPRGCVRSSVDTSGQRGRARQGAGGGEIQAT